LARKGWRRVINQEFCPSLFERKYRNENEKRMNFSPFVC
jgi:hypothetical protein